MSSKTYYKLCIACLQQYSVRYFDRHVCHRSLSKNLVHNEYIDNDIVEASDNLTDIENEAPDDNMDTNSTDDGSDDDTRDGSSDYEFSEGEETFEELLAETFVTDDEHLSDDLSKKEKLVRWICLFIALWQKKFCITDSAAAYLLRFLAVFVSVLIDEPWSQDGKAFIIKHFPGTLYSFRKYLSFNRECFTKFAVCPKCHSLYNISECVIKFGGEERSRLCEYVRFPNHPLRHLRKKCGETLMTKVICPRSGKTLFYPKKTYCYRSVKDSLKTILQCPGIEEECEKWRDLVSPSDSIFSDIYDGNLWKTFSLDGVSKYFEKERNYGLILNVDWFQPFKHLSSFSIGAIYLVLLNLPYHLRFKRKNIFLVGIIPNMSKEPPTNTYLEPLVQELEEGMNGFTIKSLKTGLKECFKLALVCVGCDIPASRKLCGFLGHSATMGCNKCKKAFPGGVGEKDFSGFDVENWEGRTMAEHKQQMIEILSAETAQEQKRLESLYGTRYSCLSALPYFDAIKMTVVDPMHNLFLGTGKHLLKIWKELGFLPKNKLELLQDQTDSFVIPHDIGKIPRKIVSSFEGFNADEYKNWVMLFSLYSLQNVLPPNHLECFRKFVLACHFLCRKVITKSDIIIGHEFLRQFCLLFETIYGKNRVTPNMHLHMHLKQCILDFGPIYGFWLFSFERFNGILGSLPSNKHDIESQIMRRFCTENIISNLKKPLQFNEFFEKIFDQLEAAGSPRGSLKDMTQRSWINFQRLSSRFVDPSQNIWYEGNELIVPRDNMSVECFTDLELQNLRDVYLYLYPEMAEVSIVFPDIFKKFLDVDIMGTRYSAKSSRNYRSSYIQAFWANNDGSIYRFGSPDGVAYPGYIEYFFKHTILIDGKSYDHWFAHCKWFLAVGNGLKEKFGKPLEVWKKNLTVPFGASAFIPLFRILSKIVFTPFTFQSQDLIVVVPRCYHSHLQ